MYFLGKDIVNEGDEKKTEKEDLAAAVVKQEPPDVAGDDKSKVKGPVMGAAGGGDGVKTEPQESHAKVRVFS